MMPDQARWFLGASLFDFMDPSSGVAAYGSQEFIKLISSLCEAIYKTTTGRRLFDAIRAAHAHLKGRGGIRIVPFEGGDPYPAGDPRGQSHVTVPHLDYPLGNSKTCLVCFDPDFCAEFAHGVMFYTPPAGILAHELIHGLDYLEGKLSGRLRITVRIRSGNAACVTNMAEARALGTGPFANASISQTRIVQELGYPPITPTGGYFIVVQPVDGQFAEPLPRPGK